MANINPTTGGTPAPSTPADLRRRARIRQKLGRGGDATYKRLGTTPPKPKATAPSPAAPAPAKPPAIDSATKRILDAAVHLRYGGQQQAINQQLQANARFGSGVGDPKGWYAQAIQEIKAQQRPVPVVQAPGPVQPTGDPTADQGAQARANLNAQWQQAQAQGAQAQNDFFDRVAAGLQVQQGNQVNQTNRDRQQILAQQTALRGDEGAFRTAQFSDMKAAQAKDILDNAKINASLLIAQGKADQAQKQLEISAKLADSLINDRNVDNSLAATDPGRAKTQADLDFFNQHGYYPPTGPPKKGKNSGSDFTRTEGAKNGHHKVIRSVNNAMDDVDRLRSQGFKDAAIKGALEKNHLPADIIGAALALSHPGGYLSDAQIKQLKLAGLIAAPKQWKRPKVRIAPARPEVSVGYPGSK